MKFFTAALIAFLACYSVFAAEPACDTRDHKNVQLTGNQLSLSEDGSTYTFKIISFEYESGTLPYSQLMRVLGFNPSPTTHSPLTPQEIMQVRRIKASLDAKGSDQVAFYVLFDRENQEVARFLNTGGDYARCVLQK